MIFTGVDVVGIARLQRMITLGGDEFLDSFWTPAELAYCGNRTDQLAARLAAKEATMKALGWGIGRIDPVDIEIVSTAGERPAVQLSRTAARREKQLGVTQWALSMSHDAGIAIAFATATGGSNV